MVNRGLVRDGRIGVGMRDFFFFSSRRRHTRYWRDWSSDVCSSDLEIVEDIRHSEGMRELYSKRSETIERVFADGKELHGLRYTQYRGLEKVKMELTLKFACMNLKKLAIWKARKGLSTLKSFLDRK